MSTPFGYENIYFVCKIMWHYSWLVVARTVIKEERRLRILSFIKDQHIIVVHSLPCLQDQG